MARPTKEDRSQVADSTLAIRFTEGLRSTLDQLVALRAAELAEEGVIDVTAGSFIRWLILKEARARGLGDPRAQPAKPDELKAPPRLSLVAAVKAPVAAVKAPKPTKTPATLIDRIEKAIANGVSASTIAKSAGVDASGLSRYRKRKGESGLSPEKEALVAAALDRI